MATAKGSPYYSVMRRFIYKMLEKGPLARLHNEAANDAIDCGSNVQKAKVISVQKIFLIFFWLMMGFLAALLTLIYEMIYFRKTPPKRPEKVRRHKLRLLRKAKTSLEELSLSLDKSDQALQDSLESTIKSIVLFENKP